MPNTKYTSFHQAFWATSEQTSRNLLRFNYDQISAAEGPQVQNRADSIKEPTFIKHKQELH